MENWPTKGMPIWSIALWKSLEFGGYFKVRNVNAYLNNPLAGSESM
jgi:hypothetical protein